MLAPVWGASTTIETANGAIIDWNNFNTVNGETVTFNQFDALGGSLSATSAVLNRITSASATQFGGALNGNGRVFVVNPAGVVFGTGSSVNVNQLIVSGLNMVNYDDVATTGALPRFEGGAGNVSTYGSINADSVCLIGKKVSNHNSINAPNGYTILAAGENVYLIQEGSNIAVEIGFNVSAEDYYGADTTPDVFNHSLIHSKDIVLAAGDTFSRAIHNTGVLTGDTITAKAAVVRNAQFIVANGYPSSSEAGGTVLLEGTEAVIMNLDYGGIPGYIKANGGTNGNGGSVTLKAGTDTTEGTVTMVPGTYIQARGGATSGDGGNVKITCNHFEVAGDIDASPQNPTYANGTLEIDPPSTVTIAGGANPGLSAQDPIIPDVVPAQDTIYEQDIETLSTTGTNLIVHAGDSITVKDLVDSIIGGRGDIEFITGPDGAIVFEDPSDMISTTRGNIGLSAGAGGIVAGSLETGDPGFVPGQINVETALGSGGSITAENLKVRDGQSSGQINVKADGNLKVNGTVAVGSVSPIDNNVSGGNVEAKVKLESGDDMTLNGPVTADSHATGSGDATSSVQLFVGIEPGSLNHGTAGDLDVVGGDLAATAQADAGTSYALVEVDTQGSISWNGHQALATADVAHVEGTETKDQVDGSDKAELIITEGHPPVLEGEPDFADTHMGDAVTVDVLANDSLATGATLDTGPTHGSVVQNLDGTFTYTPEAGYAGSDSFTYTATDGTDTTGPITVTITIGNNLPNAVADTVNTQMDQAVSGNVLTNDTDADLDSLSVVLDGTTPTHGTVVLNTNGSFTYTPTDAGYIGTDQFTYEVTDGQLDAGNPVVVTGTVTINIQAGPTPPPPPPTPVLSPVAPGLEKREIEYSGCPALEKWVSKELGMSRRTIEIWMANALASSRDIQPFESYARLRTAAVILKDNGGAHIAALNRVINEFASSSAPLTEEQMASIADAIASNAGADNQYGIAEEYLNALAQYISILNSEMGFSIEEAVQFATANYINPLAEHGNANVAAYITAKLAEL